MSRYPQRAKEEVSARVMSTPRCRKRSMIENFPVLRKKTQYGVPLLEEKCLERCSRIAQGLVHIVKQEDTSRVEQSTRVVVCLRMNAKL